MTLKGSHNVSRGYSEAKPSGKNKIIKLKINSYLPARGFLTGWTFPKVPSNGKDFSKVLILTGRTFPKSSQTGWTFPKSPIKTGRTFPKVLSLMTLKGSQSVSRGCSEAKPSGKNKITKFIIKSSLPARGFQTGRTFLKSS